MTARKSDSPLVVDGIKLDVRPDDLDDYEITELLAEAEDESLDESERNAASMRAMVRIPRLMFGADWDRIKGELRAKNGGKLSNDTVSGFVQRTFEALNRKN